MAADRDSYGPYINLQELGSGGMGAVFLAEHKHFGGTHAVKVLRRDLLGNPEAIERFTRECKILLDLNHPNIVRIREPGCEEGEWYLPMEYIRGEDLAEKISPVASIPYEQKLGWAIQILDALQAAHDRGITHRDIKPSNIRVSHKTGRIKVLDFGIARERGFRRLHIGNPGTHGYQSPEQIAGTPAIDSRSDIFSAGIVLYELFYGLHPFRTDAGQTVNDVENAIRNVPARPVPELDPPLPQRLSVIINRALEKQRDERFRTASEMRDSLVELQMPPENRAKRFVQECLTDARRALEMGQRRDLDTAIDNLDLVLRLESGHAEALSLRGRISDSLRELDELEKLVRDAEDALSSGRVSDADTAIKRALSIRPEDSRLRRLESKLKSRERHLEEDPAAQLKEAERLWKEGRLAPALRRLDKIVSNFDADRETHVQALHARMHVVDAIRREEQEKRLQEAVAHARRGERDESLKLFWALRSERPGDPRIVQAARDCGFRLEQADYSGLLDSQESLAGAADRTLDQLEGWLSSAESLIESGARCHRDFAESCEHWMRRLDSVVTRSAGTSREREIRSRLSRVEGLAGRPPSSGGSAGAEHVP